MDPSRLVYPLSRDFIIQPLQPPASSQWVSLEGSSQVETVWPIGGTPRLRASTATRLFSDHASVRPKPQQVLLNLSDRCHLLSTDAESASSSPDKIGHPSCCPVRQAPCLMSCFVLNTLCSQDFRVTCMCCRCTCDAFQRREEGSLAAFPCRITCRACG